LKIDHSLLIFFLYFQTFLLFIVLRFLSAVDFLFSSLLPRYDKKLLAFEFRHIIILVVHAIFLLVTSLVGGAVLPRLLDKDLYLLIDFLSYLQDVLRHHLFEFSMPYSLIKKVV